MSPTGTLGEQLRELGKQVRSPRMDVVLHARNAVAEALDELAAVVEAAEGRTKCESPNLRDVGGARGPVIVEEQPCDVCPACQTRILLDALRARLERSGK